MWDCGVFSLLPGLLAALVPCGKGCTGWWGSLVHSFLAGGRNPRQRSGWWTVVPGTHFGREYQGRAQGAGGTLLLAPAAMVGLLRPCTSWWKKHPCFLLPLPPP